MVLYEIISHHVKSYDIVLYYTKSFYTVYVIVYYISCHDILSILVVYILFGFNSILFLLCSAILCLSYYMVLYQIRPYYNIMYYFNLIWDYLKFVLLYANIIHCFISYHIELYYLSCSMRYHMIWHDMLSYYIISYLYDICYNI